MKLTKLHLIFGNVPSLQAWNGYLFTLVPSFPTSVSDNELYSQVMAT
jgi:hypothetical protein